METGTKSIFCAIFLLIFAASCTKNSSVVPTVSSPVTEERAGTSKKFINVLMYTKKSYDQHDAHSYAEGHILEFHLDWQSQEAVNSGKIVGALAFVKNGLLTGDTTGQAQHLFTYLLPFPHPASGYLDTYPDSALINSGQSFTDFKTWFQTTCTTWLISNDCYGNGAIGLNTSKYIMKIHSFIE